MVKIIMLSCYLLALLVPALIAAENEGTYYKYDRVCVQGNYIHMSLFACLLLRHIMYHVKCNNINRQGAYKTL